MKFPSASIKSSNGEGHFVWLVIAFSATLEMGLPSEIKTYDEINPLDNYPQIVSMKV